MKIEVFYTQFFHLINIYTNNKIFFIEQKIIKFVIQGLFKVFGYFKQNSRLFLALEQYFQNSGFFQASRLGGNPRLYEHNEERIPWLPGGGCVVGLWRREEDPEGDPRGDPGAGCRWSDSTNFIRFWLMISSVYFPTDFDDLFFINFHEVSSIWNSP